MSGEQENGDRPVAAADDAAAAVELETPTLRGDVIAASLCCIFGLLGYFVLVPNAVYVPPQFIGTINSPAFLPKLVFLVLTGLSAIYLLKSLIEWQRSPAQGRARLSDWGFAAGTALICIGYIVGIYTIGMTLASALCVAVLIYYYGERRKMVIASIALILPALLWVFFVKVANILFPTPVIPLFEIFVSWASPADCWQSASILCTVS